MKALDEVLSDKKINDSGVLLAAILCECRILYQNPDMCQWVEETFERFFLETHQELKKRVQFTSVKESIDDVLALVDLEQEKVAPNLIEQNESKVQAEQREKTGQVMADDSINASDELKEEPR